MNGRASSPSRGFTEPLWLAMLAVGGLALGAFYAVAAHVASPAAIPAAAVLIAVLVSARRRPEIGVSFVILLVPLSTFGIKPGPVSLSTLLLVLSAYMAVTATQQRRRLGPIERPGVGLCVGLFLITALLSLLAAQDVHAASHVIARLFTAALLFVATIMVINDRRSLIWVLGTLSLVAVLVGLHAAMDYTSGTTPSAGFITNSGELIGRATAGFGQPNQLGGFLVILVPIGLIGAGLARRGRVRFAIAAALAAFGVYASFSRGALIGLAVVPFVFMRGWRLALAGPCVAFVGLLAAPAAITERFATLSSSGGEIATRADIWRAALAIWERHPVIGVGVGGFPNAYATVPIPGKLYLPNTIFQPPPHAHNLFLNILAEQGLIGFVVFAMLIGVSVRVTLSLRRHAEREYRLLGSGLLAALLAFLVHNLFDVTMFDAETGPYVLVLFAVIAAAGTLARRGVSLRPAPD